MEKHLLSKSTFIRSSQCLKSFYLNKYYPKLRDAIDARQQAVFDRGHSVGELAHGLFPGGVDCSPPEAYLYHLSVEHTMYEIERGAQVIYEAAFQYDRVLAAMDILVEKEGCWYAYEVKSSTKISDTYILDAALQYYVITNSGIALDDISILYINSEYMRKGDLDIKSLFISESVLGRVLEKQDYIKQQIKTAKLTLASKEIPDVDIGLQCYSPYTCDFIGHCWPKIPKGSIFELTYLGDDKKMELFKSGVRLIKDIPDDYPLNGRQQLQKECIISGKRVIDKIALKHFLDSLRYPLYFLDFESFNPAIPPFNYTQPYRQIPFQYSLHSKESAIGTLSHHEFLAAGNGDPRKLFIEHLLNDIGNKGTILVFNKAFEGSILGQMAALYPEYSVQVNSINIRIIDLMKPFQSRAYYTPEMNGSHSIKSVLPALVPELSYNKLQITDGQMASNAYQQLMVESNANAIETIRKNLLDYCSMDTLAMVKILEVLEKTVNEI